MPEQKPRAEWPDGQRMVYELIKRHPEIFKDAPSPQDILFVLDRVNEPKSKGKPLMIRISKVADRVVDFIDAGEKSFMLEWFQRNNGRLTINQSYLLLAQQLLRFEADGDGGHKIAGYDIEEMEIVADRFGYNWAGEQKGDVADILAQDFEWGWVGQSRIRFIQDQQELDRAKEQVARSRRREQAEQSTLNLAAELVENFGLDGAKAVVAMVEEAQAATTAAAKPPDDWQPERPYVGKDNVIPFARPTGTANGN